MSAKDGLVIWLMGLAGSGKSTICKALYDKIRLKYSNVVYLDGDDMREILSASGYDRMSRIEIGKRYFRLAKFLSQQGIIVVIAAIGMFNEMYEFNRQILKNYVEVYVKCDFDELVRRDKKGLYSGGLSGKVKDVIGIDIPYDMPNPNLTIDNSALNKLDEKTNEIYNYIQYKL